jgi:hypothetical protein
MPSTLFIFCFRGTTLTLVNKWRFDNPEEGQNVNEIVSMNEALMLQNFVGMLLLFNSNFILSQYIVPPLTFLFTWTITGSFAGYTSAHTTTALVRSTLITLTAMLGNH